MLAEKVETPADLQIVRDAAIEFLQGFFFQRPEVLSGRTVSIGQLPAVRLLASIERPDVSGAEMEAIIACEPGLAYRLLRLAELLLGRRPTSGHEPAGCPRAPRPADDQESGVGRHDPRRRRQDQRAGDHRHGPSQDVRATRPFKSPPPAPPPPSWSGCCPSLTRSSTLPIAGLVAQLSLSEEISAALIDHQVSWASSSRSPSTTSAAGGARRPVTGISRIEVTLDAYVTAVPWADQTMAELARPGPATRRAATRAT